MQLREKRASALKGVSTSVVKLYEPSLFELTNNPHKNLCNFWDRDLLLYNAIISSLGVKEETKEPVTVSGKLIQEHQQQILRDKLREAVYAGRLDANLSLEIRESAESFVDCVMSLNLPENKFAELVSGLYKANLTKNSRHRDVVVPDSLFSNFFRRVYSDLSAGKVPDIQIYSGKIRNYKPLAVK